MWGTSIVGYDSYDYAYASGKTGSWPVCGFSPRAHNVTLYIVPGFDGYERLLAKLGKHKTGKSCLYIERLADVDEKVLEQLIVRSVADMKMVTVTYFRTVQSSPVKKARLRNW